MSRRIIKSRTGEVLIKNNVVSINDVIVVKNKYDAILPPTITDDYSKGFSIGSIWVDTVGKLFYVCVDTTLGAAVWSSGGGGGGSGIWQKTVITILDDVPTTVADGDRYLIGNNPTGVWENYTGYIVEYKYEKWNYTQPEIGMHLPIADISDGVYVYGGSSWDFKKYELTTATGFLDKDSYGNIAMIPEV